MFDTYQPDGLLTETQDSLLNRILVSIHKSDASKKIMSGRGKNSGPLICLQDGQQGNLAAKTADIAAPQRLPGDICLSDIQNF